MGDCLQPIGNKLGVCQVEVVGVYEQREECMQEMKELARTKMSFSEVRLFAFNWEMVRGESGGVGCYHERLWKLGLKSPGHV